jgi:hypothetical protein
VSLPIDNGAEPFRGCLEIPVTPQFDAQSYITRARLASVVRGEPYVVVQRLAPPPDASPLVVLSQRNCEWFGYQDRIVWSAA